MIEGILIGFAIGLLFGHTIARRSYRPLAERHDRLMRNLTRMQLSGRIPGGTITELLREDPR